MNKKMKKIFLILLTTIIVCFSSYSLADVGNFESYDTDFDFDFGSSSSWDSDYDYDYDDYGGTSYSDDEDGLGTLILIVIIVVIIVLKNKYGIHVQPNNIASTNMNIPVRNNVSEKIIKVDKFFNEEKFLANAKNLFVKLQTAWTERNWEVIRTFETEELFEQHSAQIKQYIDKKQINIMDRISVNYANLYDFTQDNDKDTIKVVLNSSMIDYVMEEETQKVVLGDKTTRRTRTYLLTFIRKKGVLTSESDNETKTTNCPNCGAPTLITSSGKCEYCGSVITTGDHDWVLSNLEPFRG